MLLSAELQRSVYLHLQANMVVPVHNAMPQGVEPPYVVPGDEAIQIPGPFYTHDGDGASETFFVHVWSDHQGSLVTKKIMQDVYSLLNAVTFDLDGHGVAKLQPHPALNANVIREQVDDRAKYWWHGVSPYIAWIYDPTSRQLVEECCTEST